MGSLVRAERIATGGVAVRTPSRASIMRGQGISRHRLLRFAALTNDHDLHHLALSDVYWDSIASIEPIGEHRVYDLSMAQTHNFVANDIIVHNSWVSEHLAVCIAGDST